jgi:signal transduction histidine kinase
VSASAKPHPVFSTIPSALRVDKVDARMLDIMRCVLAYSALAIIWIDPSEPARLVELTYASLAFYCLYSTALAWVSYRAGWPAPHRAAHWADILFYTFLVALTDGTSSIFFHFYVFAVLLASHSRGFREGMLATVASVVLFTTVGLIAVPGGGFELNRTLIRPVYLLALGYMIAYWGGYEMLLRRRLHLLQEVNNLWNPRFGVDHAIGTNLERMLDFYDSDACVLVLKRPGPPARFLMYSATRAKPRQAIMPVELGERFAQELLRLPGAVAAAWHDSTAKWWRRFRSHVAYDLSQHRHTASFHEECDALANLLDTRAFVTVPYLQRDGVAGRIFLTSNAGTFGQTDIEFLAQASAAVAVVVENMGLMEELISRASEYERLRVSRDLHDTTIQPYIGLKLALEALQREAGPDSRLAPRITELAEMAGMTIRDLRSYADSLKERAAMPGEFLVAAVREQGERLTRFYGIKVEVKSDISEQLSGRIAAEAYQIISEGLSNVLRHTSAKRVGVSILCENASLLLKIGNETGAGAADFMPRSIAERAQALGGVALVERDVDGYTVVHVTIPM